MMHLFVSVMLLLRILALLENRFLPFSLPLSLSLSPFVSRGRMHEQFQAPTLPFLPPFMALELYYEQQQQLLRDGPPGPKVRAEKLRRTLSASQL